MRLKGTTFRDICSRWKLEVTAERSWLTNTLWKYSEFNRWIYGNTWSWLAVVLCHQMLHHPSHYIIPIIIYNWYHKSYFNKNKLEKSKRSDIFIHLHHFWGLIPICHYSSFSVAQTMGLSYLTKKNIMTGSTLWHLTIGNLTQFPVTEEQRSNLWIRNKADMMSAFQSSHY